MSNKEKILEMLKGNELTVREIAQDLNLKENAVNVYISRLRKKELIEKIGKKNRYIIYKAIEKESNGNLKALIKNLYSLMNTKMDFIKTPDNNDIELINKIELVIK